MMELRLFIVPMIPKMPPPNPPSATELFVMVVFVNVSVPPLV